MKLLSGWGFVQVVAAGLALIGTPGYQVAAVPRPGGILSTPEDLSSHRDLPIPWSRSFNLVRDSLDLAKIRNSAGVYSRILEEQAISLVLSLIKLDPAAIASGVNGVLSANVKFPPLKKGDEIEKEWLMLQFRNEKKSVLNEKNLALGGSWFSPKIIKEYYTTKLLALNTLLDIQAQPNFGRRLFMAAEILNRGACQMARDAGMPNIKPLWQPIQVDNGNQGMTLDMLGHTFNMRLTDSKEEKEKIMSGTDHLISHVFSQLSELRKGIP